MLRHLQNLYNTEDDSAIAFFMREHSDEHLRKLFELRGILTDGTDYKKMNAMQRNAEGKIVIQYRTQGRNGGSQTVTKPGPFDYFTRLLADHPSAKRERWTLQSPVLDRHHDSFYLGFKTIFVLSAFLIIAPALIYQAFLGHSASTAALEANIKSGHCTFKKNGCSSTTRDGGTRISDCYVPQASCSTSLSLFSLHVALWGSFSFLICLMGYASKQRGARIDQWIVNDFSYKNDHDALLEAIFRKKGIEKNWAWDAPLKVGEHSLTIRGAAWAAILSFEEGAYTQFFTRMAQTFSVAAARTDRITPFALSAISGAGSCPAADSESAHAPLSQ